MHYLIQLLSVFTKLRIDNTGAWQTLRFLELVSN